MYERWTFYKDQHKEWRWKRVAASGRLVAASPQGYKNRLECIAHAKRNGWRSTPAGLVHST